MQNIIRFLFVFILFALLYVKNINILLFILPILWIVSFKDFIKLNKKVIKSIFLFNLSITLGYAFMGYLKGVFAYEYLIYINLKVYLLTYFVFWFFSKVDMIKFFSFSKELSYLLSISLSQIISYKKTYEDMRLAFKARVIKKLKERQKGFVVNGFRFFFEKALHDSKERSLAMKSRGFF